MPSVCVKHFPRCFRSILSGVFALAVLLHVYVSVRSLCFFGHAVPFCVCVLVRSPCLFGLSIVLYVSVLFTVRFLLLSYSMSLSHSHSVFCIRFLLVSYSLPLSCTKSVFSCYHILSLSHSQSVYHVRFFLLSLFCCCNILCLCPVSSPFSLAVYVCVLVPFRFLCSLAVIFSVSVDLFPFRFLCLVMPSYYISVT